MFRIFIRLFMNVQLKSSNLKLYLQSLLTRFPKIVNSLFVSCQGVGSNNSSVTVIVFATLKFLELLP